MNRLFLVLILASLIFTGCTTQSSAPQTNTTLVFVHGAHLTAQSWQPVEQLLADVNLSTLSVNLPGRSIQEDPKKITLDISSNYLCQAVQNIDGDIIYVAHSQGGAVVNQALSLCPSKQIKHIVYVASVAPLNGEKPFSRLNEADEIHYFKAVEYQEGTGWMAITKPNEFARVFASSDSKSILKTVISEAVNEPALIGDGIIKLDNNAFNQIPKSYIFTEQDKIISLPSQKLIAKHMVLENQSSLNTGHLPMITDPELLAVEIQNMIGFQ